MYKILIGSPIKQKPSILKEFIISIRELDLVDLDVKYIFIDDNTDEESSKLLNEWKNKDSNIELVKLNFDNEEEYICDEFTHNWTNNLVNKVGEFKNYIINKAKEYNVDYLFFVDSDLVLHPKTLKRLLGTKRDIISNIFWTSWEKNTIELPQVWIKDNYTLYETYYGEDITKEEEEKRTFEFLNKLKNPGTYKVGGLGACTLISKKALNKGVSFSNIYNISFVGEDRHFCIRAAALGLELYVDTYFPSYHIYREQEIDGIERFKESNKTLREDLYKNIAYKNIEEMIKRKNGNLIASKIEFINYIDKVKINLIYNKLGYKDNYSFYKEYESEIIMSLVNCNYYKKEKIIYNKERKVKISPLIRKAKEKENKITLSMVVKNEEKRYLKEVLNKAKEYIDNAVIIDDASNDNTINIIKEELKDIPYILIENKESKFSNEYELRKQQWEETIKINPDWIIFLDADEILEDKFKDKVKDMINNKEVDGYLFRLYDFWDNENYRDDILWCAHNTYRLFLIRYQENFIYKFKNTAQHCGRIPYNCINLPYSISDLRIKHYGWAKESDRIAKYNRYMELDPKGEFGDMNQYKSILDKNPNLVKWKE